MRAYNRWLRLALALGLIFSFGCGDYTAGDDDRNGRDPGEDDRDDGKPFIADTSGYTGRLSWNHGFDGIFVWDLPSSGLIYEQRVSTAGDESRMLSHPRLSGDGNSLIYVEYEPYLVGANFAVVRHVDLNSLSETEYPTDDLQAEEVRISDLATLSRDGRFIAALEKRVDMAGGLPSDETPLVIEVWNRSTGVRTRVTDGSHADRRPMISADGTRVLFLSNRGGYENDLYLANVEEDAAAQRVTDIANDSTVANFTDLTFRPHYHDVSDDLRYVVFTANSYKEADPSSTEPAFFILDTETGAISRIPVETLAAPSSGDAMILNRSVAISGDGETLAFRIGYLITDPANPRSGVVIMTAPRQDPLNTTVAFQTDSAEDGSRELLDSGALALSEDGSQIAYTRMAEELWISRADGADPRKVIDASEKRMASTTLVPTTLSF